MDEGVENETLGFFWLNVDMDEDELYQHFRKNFLEYFFSPKNSAVGVKYKTSIILQKKKKKALEMNHFCKQIYLLFEKQHFRVHFEHFVKTFKCLLLFLNIQSPIFFLNSKKLNVNSCFEKYLCCHQWNYYPRRYFPKFCKVQVHALPVVYDC